MTAPARGLRAQVAAVVAQQADTLWIRPLPRGETLSITTRELTRLEVSRGRRGHALYGAGIGLVAGAAITGGLSYAFPSDPEDCFLCGSRSFDTATGAAAGGILGALAGALVGANQRTEQWRLLVVGSPAVATVAFPARAQLHVALRHAF